MWYDFILSWSLEISNSSTQSKSFMEVKMSKGLVNCLGSEITKYFKTNLLLTGKHTLIPKYIF